MPGVLDELVSLGLLRQQPAGALSAATMNELMAAKALRQRQAYERTNIQQAMNYPQDWSQFGQNIAQAYPTSSPEAVRQAAYRAAVNAGPLMTVYHGSPHWFDKFDSSKIGTGEGAQAYGYGHYVAESPSVAKTYQGKVSAMHKVQGKNAGEVTIGGKPINWEDPQQVAAFELARHNGDRLAAAEFHARTFAGGENNPAVKLLRSQSELPKVDLPGHLYKVDIPDDQIAKMLDWDKPLSQQPEAVREGVRSALQQNGIAKSVADYIVSNKTGMEALSTLSRGAYAPNLMPASGEAAAKASDLLRQSGITGIRYLDAGSRGAGTGTSNFVVFPGNENALKILARE